MNLARWSDMSRLVNFYYALKHFLRLFIYRLKPLFHWREMWTWEYEKCQRCGSCFKLAYSLQDNIWMKLQGSECGCLCLNCAIEKALKKKIIIKPGDLTWLCLFYGDSGSYDIIEYKK